MNLFILLDVSGLNTFTTVVIQVHIADFPHTPRLCHPHILPTVTEARHHLIDLMHIKTPVTLQAQMHDVKEEIEILPLSFA